MTVDVEEYYHATIFQKATHGSSLQFESRVERQVECLLNVFATRAVLATFFILGEVAEAHRGLVRSIAAAGHEIACHDYHHDLVFQRPPHQFRADVHRAKALLEDVTGAPILGYRAPSFSITSNSAWAYDILLELGFRYDSSSYPIRHDLYGDPHGARTVHVIRAHDTHQLIECPIGTARLFGTNLPIGGGGYFRLLPLFVFRWGIHRANRLEKLPILFYIHPWEVDPGIPRPAMAWRHRFRHYVGLSRTEAKLAALLPDFSFATMRQILGL